MAKRRYTHVKELLPAIKKMAEQGKTQREIAEYWQYLLGGMTVTT